MVLSSNRQKPFMVPLIFESLNRYETTEALFSSHFMFHFLLHFILHYFCRIPPYLYLHLYQLIQPTCSVARPSAKPASGRYCLVAGGAVTASKSAYQGLGCLGFRVKVLGVSLGFRVKGLRTSSYVRAQIDKGSGTGSRQVSGIFVPPHLRVRSL